MARGGGHGPALKLQYAPAAVRDVRAEARYLFRVTRVERYGDALVRAIEAACDRLAWNPRLGREHPLFALSFFALERHTIYYQVVDDTLQVIRVLHQRRDHQKLLRRWRRPA